MAYHLLTGATGLLGTYLLRDGLRAGRRMAVIVRRSKMESPRQRIESIMTRWERELGHALPRPPVLEGDICQPNLGLDAPALNWVKQHCTSVLHNAASLSFTTNEKTGEPRRSNVEGTQNVLELCRTTGIRQFHHVSTSYVCGLRTGRVLESELDVGQELGNDYEKSKVEAEKMVRTADWIDSLTVYRPAIIVGDASTGYSTTFHGFYTPLKIGQALVDQFKPETIDGTPLLAALGLSGHEQKNFVPVDWVSRLITFLFDRPTAHDQTYHLALPQRVPVTLCQEVIEEALRRYASQQHDRRPEMSEVLEMQETFADQMGAYRAYWRDDPEFDLTNTTKVAPHLVDCRLDFTTLLRMAEFALRTNFGWPRPRPELPAYDVADHLRNTLPASLPNSEDGTVRIGLQVNGPGGGQWTLAIDRQQVVAAETGLSADTAGLVYLNSHTFEQCATGQTTLQDASRRGLVLSKTNDLTPEQLTNVLSAMIARRSDDLGTENNTLEPTASNLANST